MNMHSGETTTMETLAQSLFDEVVAPLAERRRSAGCVPYFQAKGNSDEHTYFVQPSVAIMDSADFEFPGDGDVSGLIDAVVMYWKSQGDDGLGAMAPQLKEIAEMLKKETAENEDNGDIMCYTMF
jgi:hypothetical protein